MENPGLYSKVLKLIWLYLKNPPLYLVEKKIAQPEPNGFFFHDKSSFMISLDLFWGCLVSLCNIRDSICGVIRIKNTGKSTPTNMISRAENKVLTQNWSLVPD